ncbi:MerR family transcriptional regulator [Anaeromicropila herbilytica]|uniref:MerR family transcriptional regulator n=1 Tax=Anaeromicropila herbilytica TaxID=2785025 RepID=A0A7R7EHU0_9FIRM|nr:GyrI-like domain-containing protein [Anaeromicropila herbilytica]BCN28993.1 MerR family transcriptional regulator [Anaeromicropila herbilytica]
MFRIGEFSKLCGLSADTLYHYEKQKILIPMSIDKFTGYRYYDASQIVTVNKILALKDAGFSLIEISNLLKDETPVRLLLEMLENKAQLLASTLEEEYNRLERLHTNIFLIKNGGIPQMNEIIIKTVEPILVASTRKVFAKNSFDENLEQMWPTVNNYINEKGIKRTIPCLMLYHSGWWDLKQLNIIYDEQTLDVEVVEPVTKYVEGNGEVQVYELPKIEKMACIVHHGPFSTIGKTFDTLFEWIRQNNYVADGPIREIYHKGDWVTDNPNEYITELQIPIK